MQLTALSDCLSASSVAQIGPVNDQAFEVQCQHQKIQLSAVAARKPDKPQGSH